MYPAGTYTITTSGPTTITQTATSITLSWGPPSPVPPVEPPPPVVTTVDPPVLTGHVWALAIYDPDVALSDAQKKALSSFDSKAAGLLLDIDFQGWSVRDPSVSTWIPKITEKLPVLIFVQKGSSGIGQLVYQAPLPATSADIVALEKKARGK